VGWVALAPCVVLMEHLIQYCNVVTPVLMSKILGYEELVSLCAAPEAVN